MTRDNLRNEFFDFTKDEKRIFVNIDHYEYYIEWLEDKIISVLYKNKDKYD